MSEFSDEEDVLLDDIRPSPENDIVYKPANPKSKTMRELAGSIRKLGQLVPIEVTLDGYILSGHRRYVACRMLGKERVRVRYYPATRESPEFDQLLVAFNTQRVKSLDEVIREEIVKIDPAQAYRSLLEYRDEASAIDVKEIDIRDQKKRAKISSAKDEFLNAIIDILNNYKKFWPLSDRQIHYALLNEPPLKHSKKPDSRYDNTKQSYKSLTDLLTRARLEGDIPFRAISDATRPFKENGFFENVDEFAKSVVEKLFLGYRRRLTQSQPNHIEILGEKLTIQNVIDRIARKNCIPCMIGRGYSSLDPRNKLAMRFRRSDKAKLVLLILSDFDPDGEEIAHSFARSMRDDFGIDEIVPVKVALTRDQVEELNLPPRMKAKKTSSNYARFADRYGDDVWELEALSPAELQEIIQKAIDAVIDTKLFNQEIKKEEKDAVALAEKRELALSAIGEI